MDVPSYTFLGFAAAAAVLVNLSAARAWRAAILLLANLAFVLTFVTDPRQLAPLAALLALGFASVKLFETRKSRAAFAAFLVLVVLVFCWLKRYFFVPPSLTLAFPYLTIGMSYVFFRIVHLIIDAFQNALPERVSARSYVKYTLFFPAFVAGPIQLYPEYRRTEAEPAVLDGPAARAALGRIVTGFFKVVALSALLAHVHDSAVAALAGDLSPLGRIELAALAIGVFPLYLYANFSGYTDVVIGVARYLRFELPENFDSPFLATGFIDFWGRWHITLSTWLKTYVYSPLLLALMRRHPSRAAEPYLGVLAYFVTFFLVGAWHGSSAMFLVFGLLQGIGTSANKLYQIAMVRRLGRKRYRELCAGATYAAVSRGVTFTYFAWTLLWFWIDARDFGTFVRNVGSLAFVAALVLIVAVSTVLLGALRRGLDGAWPAVGFARSRYAHAAWYTALVFVLVSLTVVVSAPAPHIVYKGF